MYPAREVKKMKKTLSVLVVTGLALAAIAFGFTRELTLTVNGKPCSPKPIEQGGEIFVPLAALKAAGAEIAQNGDRVTVRFIPVPGATQVDAVEGGLDEWLTNGVWRLKVSNPRREGSIYRLDVEIRNATKVALSLAVTTGVQLPELFSTDGGKMESLPKSDTAWGQIASPEIPPGASVQRTLEFKLKPGQTPAKLLVRFELRPTQETLMKKKGVAFASKAINFRVFLQ
ncbi:MAG: hypothetical protein D6724_01925 [Armatimonadetes bacterium]|nr:MAG: hypothetical protein D6724_01925 [Armatimonadota bacterium]